MNDITVTINNYKGKNIIYTIPEDAYIDIWITRTADSDGNQTITNANIELFNIKGINIQEEDI